MSIYVCLKFKNSYTITQIHNIYNPLFFFNDFISLVNPNFERLENKKKQKQTLKLNLVYPLLLI